MLSNVAEFCMHFIVFYGKNEIEKSEKSTKKRDSRREKRDLDFSLSLAVVPLRWNHGTMIIMNERCEENLLFECICFIHIGLSCVAS